MKTQSNNKKNLNTLLSIIFAIIMYIFFEIRFNFYPNIVLFILLFFFFIVPYFFCKRFHNIARFSILGLSILFFLLSLFYLFEPIILEKCGYDITAEYVKAKVISYHREKHESYISYFERHRHRIHRSSWGKYKLENNGKILRLSSVPYNKIGDTVNLVKLKFTKKNAIVKNFVIYMPSNYKVKYFETDKNTIQYKDLINNLTITLNNTFQGDNLTFFNNKLPDNSINFAIYEENSIKKYLLNFSEENPIGIKEILDTTFGKLYIYYEGTLKDHLHGILKLNKSNDYMVISIPLSLIPVDINNDPQKLTLYFKNIITDTD